MADCSGQVPYGISISPIPGGRFADLTEKNQFIGEGSDVKKSSEDDADDSEDNMDALIEDLESHDGRADEEYEASDDFDSAGAVPDELLQTNTRTGLTDSEVLARRKKYGLNQMKEETENLFLKFLSYFVGPIQFVMEVCQSCFVSKITVSDISISRT